MEIPEIEYTKEEMIDHNVKVLKLLSERLMSRLSKIDDIHYGNELRLSKKMELNFDGYDDLLQWMKDDCGTIILMSEKLKELL